jgi:hypothetical protein
MDGDSGENADEELAGEGFPYAFLPKNACGHLGLAPGRP